MPDDYRPIDLSRYQNAGVEVLTGPLRPAVGHTSLRGIPFRIGDTTGGERPYVVLGPGYREEPLRIAVDQPARTIVVAHLLIASAIPDGGPIGEQVAEYVFELEGGDRHSVAIRELFEIAVLPRPDAPFGDMHAWRIASAPFLALPDRFDQLTPRARGSVGARGPTPDGGGTSVLRRLQALGLAESDGSQGDGDGDSPKPAAVRGCGDHRRDRRRGSIRTRRQGAHPADASRVPRPERPARPRHRRGSRRRNGGVAGAPGRSR